MIENRTIVAGIRQCGEDSEALRLERFVIVIVIVAVILLEVRRCGGRGRRIGEIGA